MVGIEVESAGEARHVSRTLRALERIAIGPRSEAELARECNAHPRTIRRLLRRLEAEGYVIEVNQGRRRGYAATLKVVALAGHVLQGRDLARDAFAYVTLLRRRTGESAHLSVPRDDAVMHLVDEMGESVVTVRSRVGELVPYHSTAVGKALLAFLPRQAELILSQPLERFTAFSIVDRADLVTELAIIRDRGYAIDDRENSLELRCVAAPVFDFSAEAVGALGVSAPVDRFPPHELSLAATAVVEIAQAFSEALGFGGPRANNGRAH